MPIARGELIHTHKLDASDVREIRRLLDTGKAQAVIAREFNVTRQAINDIWKGRSWSHV
jgi:IS30 family transposase